MITSLPTVLHLPDVVRENCTQYEISELETIQNEAARVLLLVFQNKYQSKIYYEKLVGKGIPKKEETRNTFFSVLQDAKRFITPNTYPP